VTNSVADELLVVVIVLILGLFMRWAFRSSRPKRSNVASVGGATDLGLLEVISTGLSRADAMSMRAELGEVGIRSSMSHQRDGRLDVLVFRDDLARAKAVLKLP
jgi:hypothetical protein